jgi:hypothetical protein
MTVVVVLVLALASCAQPELRGGVSAAQFQQIKLVIRAETHARITTVTLQSDGLIFVETMGSSYLLRHVKNSWEIVKETVTIHES